MKTYWRLLGFAKPIEKYAIPYFFCTLLYAFFNVCTFTLIMPIVNSLFSPDGALQAVTEMPVFSIRHLTDYISALLSYLLYRLFGSDYDIMDVLIMLACVVVTASLLSNLFRYLAQRIIENMRVRTLCRLRDRVYEHVLSMNLGFFSNERKGDIMARITSDVQVVQFCITNTLQVVFRDPFLILFYVVAMLAISVQLSLFSVIYLPVVALLIGTIVKRLRRSAKEVQESFGELTSVLDESLSGMKVIKGYNAETFFGRRFNDINRKFSDISRRIAYRQQLASPMSEFLGIAAAAGLLIFGGILVTGGKLDAGGFLTYLAIFTQITRPMRSFTDAFATINQGIAAGDRVLRLLDTETSVRNAPDAVQLDHFRERIEFRDVRFAYEEREVICGISFTVEKGQTVALVGPSGGGKSTIRQAKSASTAATSDSTTCTPCASGWASWRRIPYSLTTPSRITSAWATPKPRAKRSWMRHASPTPNSSSQRLPTAWRRTSATAARNSPAGSVSASASPAPFSKTPKSSSSTRRHPPSTPRAKNSYRRPSTHCSKGAHPSSSPTV